MNKLSGLVLAASLLLPTSALAHTPLFSCYDMGDGTIECEGGYSNGNSAAGTKVIVADTAGKELQSLALDDNSIIVITKPSGDYTVTMDGGEGHRVTLNGADITE